MDVELEPGALVQPDVFVVSPNESRRMLRELPVREMMVAVEVLSPTSGRHDRVTKRRVYSRPAELLRLGLPRNGSLTG